MLAVLAGIQIITISLVALAVFLRMYHLADSMMFFGDQGSLLLIAQKIVVEGHRPLIGPIVSVPGFSIPPWNYYLVALFEMVTQDPVRIAFLFVAMNVVAGAVWVIFARAVSDAWSGVLMLFFYSLSAAMVDQARNIWEPHPSTLFVALYILFSEAGFRKRSLSVTVLALLCYGAALGLYPSSLLLLPFVVVRTFRFVRTVSSKPLVPAMFLAGTLVGAACSVYWMPVFLFEWQYGFPMARALLSGAFGMPAAGSILPRLWSYLLLILRDVLPVNHAFIFHLALLAIFASGIRDLIRLLTPEWAWLAAGLFLPLAYRNETHGYRFSILYPFIFFMLSLLLRTWLGRGSRCPKITAISIMLFFGVTQLSAWTTETLWYPKKELPRAKIIRMAILQDAARRQLSLDSIGIHLMSPSDSWDYDASTLYYLMSKDGYKVSLNDAGNDINRSISETRLFVYLVCEDRIGEPGMTDCLELFLYRKPEYRNLSSVPVQPSATIYVLQRQ